jgi:hypothetical protein
MLDLLGFVAFRGFWMINPPEMMFKNLSMTISLF